MDCISGEYGWQPVGDFFLGRLDDWSEVDISWFFG